MAELVGGFGKIQSWKKKLHRQIMIFIFEENFRMNRVGNVACILLRPVI